MDLIIQRKAFFKLKYFCEHVDGEISGLGKSSVDKDKNIILEDVIIFKQTCSYASTNIDNDAIAQFIYQLQKKGESVENYNVWWHSHANMGVFWSATDDKTIENHCGGGNFLISLVTNKAGDYKARLDVFPKDLSPFNKETYATFDLDVKKELINPKTKEGKEIKKLEHQMEIKQRLIERVAKEISNHKEQIEDLSTVDKDINLENKCKKEIEEKVTSLSNNLGWGKKFKHYPKEKIGFNTDEYMDKYFEDKFYSN